MDEQGIAKDERPAQLAHKSTEGRLEITPHFRAISDEFVRVVEGESERVSIELPPRSGLSTILMKFGPLWALRAHPEKRILVVTYSREAAHAWARGVGQAYGSQASSGSIRTSQGGGVDFVGVGDAVCGSPFDAVILDAPVRDLAQAHSPVAMAYLGNYFDELVRTRVSPEASVLVAGPRPMHGPLTDGPGWRRVCLREEAA